ncbi:glycosyl hydrolase family 18 protein [Lachnospiraceae bacterium 66-29]
MSETVKQRNRRQKRPKLNMAPILAALAFIGIVVLLALGSVVIKKYTPSKERVDLDNYYHLQAKDDMALILDHKLLEETAKYWDGCVYLKYQLVQQYLNQRFFWDSNENILRYTTESDVISVHLGEESYMVGKKNKKADHTIVKVDGESVYVSLDFVQNYTNLDFVLYEEPNRVLITANWGEITKADIKKNTQIRVKGGIKSPIVADVLKGSSVTILDKGENWSRVCTEEGHAGYLKNKMLVEERSERISREFEEPEFTHLLKDEPISLGWHQVTSPEANDKIANVLQSTKGINVVSPTWFYLNDNDGNLFSLADKDYVDYCHKNDVEVWALVSNLENPDVDTTYVLTHTSTRDYLTNQIISAAIEYNFDGINLDFEALSGEVGDAYIQFIRELSIKCENNDLVLSVDNYVPSSYTAFYNRKEQAVFADYVIIMGYDEHTSISEDIGSVASIGFVEKGVTDTLLEVPPEQTILAMPFYTRIWELTPKAGSGEDVESASEGYIPYTFTCFEEGMQTVENRYTENGAQAVWSEEDGQYVAEYQKDGKTYKMWIENESSLEEKLKIMKQHQLAGAAYWKLGFERPSAWNTIIKYVN